MVALERVELGMMPSGTEVEMNRWLPEAGRIQVLNEGVFVYEAARKVGSIERSMLCCMFLCVWTFWVYDE